jgi:hypothetical protein
MILYVKFSQNAQKHLKSMILYGKFNQNKHKNSQNSTKTPQIDDFICKNQSK